jgi:hypothetical protein
MELGHEAQDFCADPSEPEALKPFFLEKRSMG